MTRRAWHAVIAAFALFAAAFMLRNGSGQFLAQTAQKDSCPAPIPREFDSEPYYTDQRVDAHLHLPTVSGIVSSVSTKMGKSTPAWDKELTVRYVTCLFANEGVSKAFGFHLLTKYSAAAEVRMAKQMDRQYPGKFVHFLMPTFLSPWIDVDATGVRKIVEKNPGLFKGIGEMKFFDGRSPDDPRVLPFYDLATKHNLIIMMHPFDHHKEAVAGLLAKYPTVKFLLHGLHGEAGPRNAKQNIAWIVSMMREHPNLYYSVDHSLSIYGFEREHLGTVVPAAEILPKIREQFRQKIQEEVALWLRHIEALPDRFLGGGTDRWHRPQYEPEMGALINEFMRSSVMARLSPAAQKKFAYENAERLLGAALPN